MVVGVYVCMYGFHKYMKMNDMQPYATKSLFKGNLPQVPHYSSQKKVISDQHLETINNWWLIPTTIFSSWAISQIAAWRLSFIIETWLAGCSHDIPNCVLWEMPGGRRIFAATRCLTYRTIHHISFLMVCDVSAYSTSYIYSIKKYHLKIYSEMYIYVDITTNSQNKATY